MKIYNVLEAAFGMNVWAEKMFVSGSINLKMVANQ